MIRRNLIEPQSRNGHEFVDLGLPSGLKWAKYNIGYGSHETNNGLNSFYFTAGDITPHVFTTRNVDLQYNSLAYGYYEFSPEYYKFQKNTSYTSTSSIGMPPQNGGILLSEYDAATQLWGGLWRTPTPDDFRELINNTTVTRVSLDTYGAVYVFTNSATGAHIDLPACGTINGTSNSYYGTSNYSNGCCMYWTSDMSSSYSNSTYCSAWFANYFNIYGTGTSITKQVNNDGNKYIGRPIRPVHP